jgi:acyl-CoA oxidase
MSLVPDWVNKLKPAEPQGGDILTIERGRSSLQSDKMATFLFGNAKLQRKKEIEDILKNDPVFDKKNNYFDGRVDKFKTALARAKRSRQLAVKYGWDDMDMEIARKLMTEPDPYGLHSRYD